MTSIFLSRYSYFLLDYMTLLIAFSPWPIMLIVSAFNSATSSILEAMDLLQEFLASTSPIWASHLPLAWSLVLVTKVSPLIYSFWSSASALIWACSAIPLALISATDFWALALIISSSLVSRVICFEKSSSIESLCSYLFYLSKSRSSSSLISLISKLCFSFSISFKEPN